MATAALQGPTAADPIADAAARLTWRDTPLAAWLVNRRLQQGRPAEAIDQADSLLRRDIDPILRRRLEDLLVFVAGDVALRPLLISHLAARPSWRVDFLQRLVAAGEARALLTALAEGPAPPTPAEYAAFIDGEVAAGDYARAFDDWRIFTGRRGLAGPTLDLADAADTTAFTWSPVQGIGASTDIRPGPPALGGKALRVVYDGAASPILPRRMLLLPPGPYRLIGQQRTEQSTGAVRLRWQVLCAGGAGLAQTAPPAPDPAWRLWSLEFTVPEGGCPAQWLRLSPEPGERQSPATQWFAALRVASGQSDPGRP